MTSHEGSHAEEFPEGGQGIIVDASEGITLEECKVAIENLIGPSNIRSASTSAEGLPV
ncbi:uncharacterized protein LOC143211395 isoform X2 [Lasioglossum baleicum]|uniref:uncharacterized protein LOC143211395 isoform X2 n=1 Tax=Lasioglossum baleicum TaxID=434251 RepID=UPI003FCDC185